MIVKSLELDFFRNYTHLSARFDPRVNLIYGDNAQGKTNLLEAIAYLSTARSHRARYDREMIMMDIDSAFLKGEIQSRDRDFTLEAKLRSARLRKIAIIRFFIVVVHLSFCAIVSEMFWYFFMVFEKEAAYAHLR